MRATPGLPPRNDLPSPLLVLAVLFSLAVIAAFVALLVVYSPEQPLLVVLLPIPLASSLIVTTVVHDRQLAQPTA